MQNTLTLARPAGLDLRQWLIIDALTCLVTGVAFVAATNLLAGLLGLPEGLLRYAGLVLFPCAALMFIAARSLARPLVWTVILGNFAWTLASVVVAFAFEPTTLGFAFTLGQAAAVALLGCFEWRATR